MGTEVSPSEMPKSKTWKRSPAANASVTISTAPCGAAKVHGGAVRNEVRVPELGIQNGPAGSAGSRPGAGGPAREEAKPRKKPGVGGPGGGGGGEKKYESAGTKA